MLPVLYVSEILQQCMKIPSAISIAHVLPLSWRLKQSKQDDGYFTLVSLAGHQGPSNSQFCDFFYFSLHFYIFALRAKYEKVAGWPSEQPRRLVEVIRSMIGQQPKLPVTS